MAARKTGTKPAKAKADLSKWALKESDSIDKSITKLSKLAQIQLQKEINSVIDKPTAFTQRALGFKYEKHSNGTRNRIFMFPNQSNYLDRILKQGHGNSSTKFRPFSYTTRLNIYGNIAGLRNKNNFKRLTLNGKPALANQRNVITGIYKTHTYKPLMDYDAVSRKLVGNIKYRIRKIKDQK
jgi:hypothetical protein